MTFDNKCNVNVTNKRQIIPKGQ